MAQDRPDQGCHQQMAHLESAAHGFREQSAQESFPLALSQLQERRASRRIRRVLRIHQGLLERAPLHLREVGEVAGVFAEKMRRIRGQPRCACLDAQNVVAESPRQR